MPSVVIFRTRRAEVLIHSVSSVEAGFQDALFHSIPSPKAALPRRPSCLPAGKEQADVISLPGRLSWRQWQLVCSWELAEAARGRGWFVVEPC